MKTMKQWDEFKRTGKIDDYLKYTKSKELGSLSQLNLSYGEEFSEELSVGKNEENK